MSQVLWAIATPVQTAILGHLSADAIAANSVSTTLFQYLKVITVGEASASSVIIGRTVGEGDESKVREYSRTLQLLYLTVAIVLGVALFFIRIPLLSIYSLNDTARRMANQIIILLCFVIVGMGYQMPAGVGIIKGGGDVKFSMYLNLISTWGIVMPLSFAVAFWWKLPVVAVVFFLNSDQIFKCVPIAIRVNRYRWIHHLTREEKSV
ncbi:MAG: transporter MATE [Clostridiales bacterium]|nr:transporter MATE [Clostridiales bacterium]